MYASHTGGEYDLLRINLAEARDVIADGAFEQLDILRQIT